MKAELLFTDKYVYEDGAICEMVIWRLPTPDPERLHRLKYRLYYGQFGRYLVCYDSKRGKGDYRHYGDVEAHLNFEDLSMLLAVITPRRLEVLKTLRQLGPISVRALASILAGDYKNVHTDTCALEEVGLLERTESGILQGPWDAIDAHLSLVAEE